jgi:hypothetical protein
MRPRLRADVRYVKSPDGVYVHGFAGACTLTGDTSYEWLDRLAPFLTGEHVLDDLVGPLGGDQRAVVEHLVRSLHEQRLLVDALDDVPHTLTEEEQRVYEPEIAFIRYATDSAEHRFERLRSARVALLGGGPVLAAVLEAGLRSGWRRVSFRTGDDPDGLRAVARGAMRDRAQDVTVEGGPGLPDDADLLLCVSGSRDDLLAAARASARSGVAVGQVLVGGVEAWVTAVGPPARVAAESCWRRLVAWRGEGADGGLLTGPAPGVIAAHLVLSCFQHLTGSPADEPGLTRIDLRDLTARTHRPRPYAVTGRVRLDAVIEPDGFPERVRRLVDDRVGVLGRLDEDDLPQVPLAVCRASASDPEVVLPAWAAAPEVTGWGVDRDEARWRAALAGLATYGSLVDARGGERLDLLTGAPCAVAPIAAHVPYRAPVGVAAGRSWGDAAAAGLRAHCEVLLAERTGQRCDLAAAVRDSGDERAAELLRFLQAAAVDVEATDLGGALGVPAFTVTLTGTSITTCSTTVAEALRDALERAVLHWQCGLPEDAAITRWTGEGDRSAPADDPRCRTLSAALRRAGRAPVAVPLLVDDDVHSLAPCLVRVVVRDD